MLKSYKIGSHGLKRTELTKSNWIHLEQTKKNDFDSITDLKIRKRDFDSCLDRSERSRIVVRENYSLIVLKINSKKQNRSVTMGIFLFDKKIITIHEFSCPFVLDIVNHPENITSINSLLIRIIQEITKTFFVETRRLEEEVNKIEEKIGTSSSKSTLEKLFRVRKDLVFLVRSISGNRDVINSMISNASMFKLNKLEKLDLSEIHTDQIQLAETMAIYREILSNAVEIYNSNISQEMNKIMQRLAVVGSFILLPTLIASIYGMNFKPDISPYNMPELNWKYGYIFSLGLMAISIIGTYSYFKIKKWI